MLALRSRCRWQQALASARIDISGGMRGFASQMSHTVPFAHGCSEAGWTMLSENVSWTQGREGGWGELERPTKHDV